VLARRFAKARVLLSDSAGCCATTTLRRHGPQAHELHRHPPAVAVRNNAPAVI
jgi:hypothetical protein